MGVVAIIPRSPACGFGRSHEAIGETVGRGAVRRGHSLRVQAKVSLRNAPSTCASGEWCGLDE
jgi:hypothetical protein